MGKTRVRDFRGIRRRQRLPTRTGGMSSFRGGADVQLQTPPGATLAFPQTRRTILSSV